MSQLDRHIPIINTNGKYYVTTDIDFAMHNGYIGEVFIKPKIIVNCIKKALNMRQLSPFTVFYYGTPDESLKRKFGYE